MNKIETLESWNLAAKIRQITEKLRHYNGVLWRADYSSLMLQSAGMVRGSNELKLVLKHKMVELNMDG